MGGFRQALGYGVGFLGLPWASLGQALGFAWRIQSLCLVGLLGLLFFSAWPGRARLMVFALNVSRACLPKLFLHFFLHA